MVFPLHLDKTERQQEIPSLDKTQKIENHAIGKAYKMHLDETSTNIVNHLTCVRYNTKSEHALLNVFFVSVPTIMPAGSLDLTMRMMDAAGSCSFQ